MAITYTDNGGGAPNGSKLEFTFTFPVIQTEDTKVALNAVVQATTKYAVDLSSNPTKITFNSNNIDSTVQESTGAPKTGVLVRVFRETQVGKTSGDSDPKAVYAAGSSIRAVDLNANTEQALYAIHELQDQPLTDQNIQDGSITSAKIKDGTIANVDVSATAAIDGTKVDPNFGSQNITTTGTVNGVSTTELSILEGATVSTTELNILDGVTANKDELNTLDGVSINLTASELNYVDGVTSNIQTQLDNKQASSTTLTTLAGMQSTTASKLADNTGLTADLADLNELDGMAKQTTITDDDTKFPTSGAVIDYVAAQLAPIGGFEVIPTETFFPNVQPASGVVISIADAGGLVVNGSGTSTTGRTINGTVVTINNFNSNFNSSTVDPGVAILVSSTGSNQVYNYHKATLKEADLLSLSGDINDFAERYRVVNGEPTSGNDEGDLIYDKIADKIKVFDSTTNSFKLVDAVGDFKFLFLCPTGGTGAPTLNGSINTYDLRIGSSSGTLANVQNAAQLIVSIDGVIQKPNTGTSQPSEGFALVDINTIIFGSNLAAGANVFIIQIGAEVGIGVPGDNQVSTDKLQNLSVTTNKLANDSVTTDKLANSIVSDITTNNAKVSNVTTNLSTSTTTTTVTVASSDGTNATIGEATGSAAGVMSSAHHDKLDGIEASATADQTASEIVALVADQTIAPSTIDMEDNEKIKLGTGDDLEIFHDGSNSRLKDVGTGVLAISGSDVHIQNNNNTQSIAKFLGGTTNSSAELYYNDSKKFNTTSDGGTLTGNLFVSEALQLNDSKKIELGSSADLEIYHDGSSSVIKNKTGDLYVQSIQDLKLRTNDSELAVDCTVNAGVDLYYDGSKKLETTSSGVSVPSDLLVTGNFTLDNATNAGKDISWNQGENKIKFEDSVAANFGSGNDLRIYHDGTNSYFYNLTGELRNRAATWKVLNALNNEIQIQATENGAVELYYDNSKKLETLSDGVNVTGTLKVNGSAIASGGLGNVVEDTTPQLGGDLQSNGNDIDFADNDKAIFGTGSDLEIYHDGTHSRISDTGTGFLVLQTSKLQVNNAASNEEMLTATENGAVELFYDNVKKFETTALGVKAEYYTGEDNAQLRLGDSGDFQIYHDGTHTRVHNNTGYIQARSAGYAFNNAAGTENCLDIIQNANINIYYDGSKKFETTSTGVEITGKLTFAGDGHTQGIELGADADIVFYHDNSNGYLDNNVGDLYLRNDGSSTSEKVRIQAKGGEQSIVCSPNAGVELYYNNSKKFETSDWGNKFHGGLSADDSTKVQLGNGGDLQIYHDGSNSRIHNLTGELIFRTGSNYVFYNSDASEKHAKFNQNGSVELYYDNVKTFETLSNGNRFHGYLYAGDNEVLYLGNSNDLRLFHDGTNSYIRNETGELRPQADAIKFRNNANNQTMLNCVAGGEVELFYDNAKKFDTFASGCEVFGSLYVGNPGGSVFSGLSNYQGYVGFNTTSSSSFGGVAMGSGPNGNSPFVAATKSGSGTGLNLHFRTNGTKKFEIQNNGNIGAPSGSNIYYASDQRLKKNVTSLDKGLEAVEALRPVSFNWVDGFCDVEKDKLYGFIAQEVETVDSNLVSPFGDDVELGEDQVVTNPLRVNEKFIIPMLVKAVQELSAKVAALEAK